MATFKSRLPSSHDILLTFAAIVFPIHLQAFVSWMIPAPSLLMRFTLWDTIGFISYVHVFALIECGIILLVLLSISALLGDKHYRSQFASVSTMFIFLTVPFIFVFIFLLKFRAMYSALAIVLIIYIVLFAVLYWVIRKFQRVENFFYNLASLLMVLSLLYISVDVVAIFILIVRRIGL